MLAPFALPLLAGILSLIPPTIIGTGSSGLVYQSLYHWIQGSPDPFAVLHIHWLWIPRVLAFVTDGDAFAALLIFKAILIVLTIFLFFRIAVRTFDTTRGNGRPHAYWAAALLTFNVTVLYLSHTFGTELMTLFMAVWLLYLFTSPNPKNHQVAAILFGLSLSIGFWPFILLIAVFTVGLNYHHTIYTPRSKRTYQLIGLILIGAASWLMLQIFYFGTSNVWAAINPKFYRPREANLILQGVIIALFSVNLLFAAVFIRKRGTLAREYQSAFIILGIFFLLNTFSREQMLADTTILLPCIILVMLDRLPFKGSRIGTARISFFGISYLVLNVVLFFLIPSFTNDPQIALSVTRRTKASEDISWHYYDNFDLFSYPKLIEKQSGEDEAHKLLSGVRLDSTLVLINPGTDYWFDAGTLGAEFPNSKFGWFYGNPINMVRLNGLKDTAFIRPAAATPYLSGLFDKTFAHQFIDSVLPSGIPLRESERFQYIDTRGNESGRRALIDRLIYWQYQGFHH